jgi:hypothetical protein
MTKAATNSDTSRHLQRAALDPKRIAETEAAPTQLVVGPLSLTGQADRTKFLAKFPADADPGPRRTAWGVETDHGTVALECMPTLTTALGKNMFGVLIVKGTVQPADGQKCAPPPKGGPGKRPRKAQRRSAPGQFKLPL